MFPEAAASYRAKLRDPAARGAVFMAVCRGKASEGLDFADAAGRAVVITGLPYAMKTDPKARAPAPRRPRAGVRPCGVRWVASCSMSAGASPLRAGELARSLRMPLGDPAAQGAVPRATPAASRCARRARRCA
jgi:hypothetical protein